uniref:Methyltransferase domain-containing protein n=1 Tax=Candidatus Kentrum sp. MB TaxID=2138164 RepID=A0A450XEP3_9GAMM|nr:MAG: Methyltransferase domain-containing protein [Candidatus Kentron sp. MB]VFK30238.1 MAG: Methyltransferase domain-containing protein [Candidatus Kentron sp. MB]VFK75146.1 MAG: Methyltransferase domain-containing protein [Candidatus Kentron sp. MB]
MRQRTTKELHKERIKLWDATISTRKKYIDKNTGFFKEEFVENRNCPVCNSAQHLFLFQKEGGIYVKCMDCSMVFLNPVFKDHALHDYYKNNHALQAEIVESDIQFYNRLYNQGLDQIENSLKNPSSRLILDIGCSSGTFLDAAKKRGWETYGIELNEAEFKQSVSKGHKVYSDSIQNMAPEETFDAITMWDVFEHIKEGESYLNFVKSCLNKTGIIFLQIPSSASLAARILHEECNMFDGLEHVNLYCMESISILFRKCGLKMMNVTTVISEIGVINNYLNYDNPYFGNSKNREDILSLVDEKTIHKNLLGYKYQITLSNTP